VAQRTALYRAVPK